MPTPFLKVIPQQHDADCGVACLAMFLGVSYAEALNAFRHNIVQEGTSIRQLQAAAGRLKRPLVWTRKVNLDEDTGILNVTSQGWHRDHMVILKDELIIDTDLSIWEAPAFMMVYKARPISILFEEGEE